MKIVIFLLILFISNLASATAFSLGTGNYWKQICSGKHDELDKKGAIASCTMLLFGYQVGAYEQAKILSKPSTLCRSLDVEHLPKEFVDYVNSDIKFEKMDVLDVLLHFTKGEKCND